VKKSSKKTNVLKMNIMKKNVVKKNVRVKKENGYGKLQKEP